MGVKGDEKARDDVTRNFLDLDKDGHVPEVLNSQQLLVLKRSLSISGISGAQPRKSQDFSNDLREHEHLND